MTPGHNTPTVVFLHGWGSDSRIWQAVQAELDWPSMTWDLPGFGAHASDLSPVLDDFIRDCIKCLPQACVLVGWSLGGMLATRLAALAPEQVKGLVTLATNPAFVHTATWPQAMSSADYQSFCTSFARLPHKAFQRFCSLQVQGHANAKALLDELRSYAPQAHQLQQWLTALDWLHALNNEHLLASVNLPQLHLFGAQDALVPPEAADRLAKLQAGCTHVVDGGHCLPLSHPQWVAGRITAFMRQFNAISKGRIAASFSNAAVHYDAHANIQKRIGAHLLSAVDAPLFGTWLDLGCGTGFLHTALTADGQPGLWLNGDIAEGMLRIAKRRCAAAGNVCFDAAHLPFAQASFDGVISNLTLQWCEPLAATLQAVFAALKPGATLYANTLVEGSLAELKQAWAEVDEFVHVNKFHTANYVQAALLECGFALESVSEAPVVDWHADLFSALRSLKGIGAHNMNAGQNPGLTTRHQLQRLTAAYQPFLTDTGCFPVTYQVLQFCARKP